MSLRPVYCPVCGKDISPGCDCRKEENMGEIIEMSGVSRFTPNMILNSSRDRHPQVVAMVERTGDDWNWSFSAMSRLMVYECIGALETLKNALMEELAKSK